MNYMLPYVLSRRVLVCMLSGLLPIVATAAQSVRNNIFEGGYSTTELARVDAAGAIVQFLGTVRNHSSDAAVASLEYEAYPEMAEKTIARIIEEARRRWPFEFAAARPVVRQLTVVNHGDVFEWKRPIGMCGTDVDVRLGRHSRRH